MDRLFDLSGRLSMALGVIAKLLIGVIVVLVAADVVSRNIWRSLNWSASAVEYMMVWVTFIAAPALVRLKAHVCADFIRMSLPRSVQVVLEKAVYVLCIGLCVWLASHATRKFVETWKSGAYDVRNFDMPYWLIFLPMVVGLWLSALEFLRYLLGRDSIYAIAPSEREGF